MIVIVDMGMGNLGSILNMLERVKAEAVVSSDPKTISCADKLILPGVGAFDTAMRHLLGTELGELLNHKVLDERTPILGICLGLQLFTTSSEEGALPGLGWIKGRTVKFNFKNGANYGQRIPHMGWNTVTIKQSPPNIFQGMEEPRFYFVHSYHLVCDNEEDILTTTHYGYDFVSSVHSGNIWGTQFHPEKSHRFGMKLLSNFAEMP